MFILPPMSITDSRVLILLKGNEFNSDALSNVVASFFHILKAKKKCEQSWQPCLTELHR